MRRAGCGLHGLVSHAGVAVMGPFTESKEEDLRFVLDVSVLGPYRVTKAFASLLLESGGRITTISSIAGVLSRPPLGAYSMSKHAVEVAEAVMHALFDAKPKRRHMVVPDERDAALGRKP